MSTSSDRSAAMTAGRRAASQRRRQRVAKALHAAAVSGAEISISAIARTAGVDRSFFYRPQHRDLLAAVEAAAIEPRGRLRIHAGRAVTRALGPPRPWWWRLDTGAAKSRFRFLRLTFYFRKTLFQVIRPYILPSTRKR